MLSTGGNLQAAKPITPIIVAAPPEKRNLLRNLTIVVGAVVLGLSAIVGAAGDGDARSTTTPSASRETPVRETPSPGSSAAYDSEYVAIVDDIFLAARSDNEYLLSDSATRLAQFCVDNYRTDVGDGLGH